MAVFYNAGEQKNRPGLYQRYVNAAFASQGESDARDGICAIPIQASWGPLGKVVANSNSVQLQTNYGYGTYGPGYTVPAAAAMFAGGAATVYTYRLGTGGTKATKAIAGATEGQSLTVTAKYEGTMPIAVAIQAKLGDSSKKTILIYANSVQVESFDFTADSTNEGNNLIAAVANSKYITIAVTASSTAPATVPALALASGALTGGANPTVTNGDYSNAFAALEPYYYNTIALDVDDDENMTLSLLLQAYLDGAYQTGKLGIAVVGEKTTVTFSTRLQHAQSFDDAKVVYLGGGYMAGTENKDGALAICYTAGVIASTPSNQGITHTTISDATDLCESLTFAQYSTAVEYGMLMISMGPSGEIWYDSGITTFTDEENATMDAGWKKIRRVKVRFELIDRLDRELAPKVGRVSADSDGVADIVQAGQRVLDAMSDTEGKLQAGATFKEDPDYPFTSDSAWFIIVANDVDSLEKIYLQYQFRYSQEA